MHRFFINIIFYLLITISVQANELSKKEILNIQKVISSQLEAFQERNGEKAFSYASPFIKNQFQNPYIFMQMVERYYDPVFNSASHTFTEISSNQGYFTQEVLIIDINNQQHAAIYSMIFIDDDWKIAGCYLKPAQENFI